MSALPIPVAQSLAPVPSESDTAVWEMHFGDPAKAIARVREILGAPHRHDERALAWAELTAGFHQLFFTGNPRESRSLLESAGARFLALGDRRGALLVDTGNARLLILQQKAEQARENLTALYPEARALLPPRDLFWVINTLSATHYYAEQLDEAIRSMYQALEILRSTELSPQLVTVLSNLAAALVTVGDYEPARDLAQEAVELLGRYRNDQLILYARSNLCDALLGTGNREAALATAEAMFPGRRPERLSPQNHYCAIAAEVYALHGRVSEARDAADLAAEIYRASSSGFNEVHVHWSAACVAVASDPGAGALPALERAAEVAARHRHLPVMCKAYRAMAERCAALGRFEEAYRHQQQLFEANNARMCSRASARYYLLRTEFELDGMRAERDREHEKRQEYETLNRELEQLNAELSRKMREVEELQLRLAVEAVHDPLTQLFNRRYLDSAMPGLIGASERRGTPLTLALVDLDHFKRVNDRHGHLAGDKVLRRIGALFASSLRPSDVVARWGGEEFCIVFPDTDIPGAATALATLSSRLRALEIDWAGTTIGQFTFSAALAAFGTHGSTLGELVLAADHALYEAKGAGRDRVLVASGG